VRKLIWNFYRDLKAYRCAPTKQRKAAANSSDPAGHRLGCGGNGGCRFLGGRLAAIVPLERVETFLSIVRHQLRFLLEQPGNVARDAPFVSADVPDTGFRVHDAPRSRAHHSRIGIGAILLSPEQYVPILGVPSCSHAAQNHIPGNIDAPVGIHRGIELAPGIAKAKAAGVYKGRAAQRSLGRRRGERLNPYRIASRGDACRSALRACKKAQNWRRAT
jgi:hypothetical protein